MLLNYQYPTSWGNEELDARKIDSWMKLKLAILERANALGMSLRNSLHKISPTRPPCFEWAFAIRDSIHTFCDRDSYNTNNPNANNSAFYNLEYAHKDDGSDFPHKWTWHELVNSDGCNVAKMPSRGALLSEFNEWMNCCKKALNKLTVCDNYFMTVMAFSKSASYNGYSAVRDEIGAIDYDATVAKGLQKVQEKLGEQDFTIYKNATINSGNSATIDLYSRCTVREVVQGGTTGTAWNASGAIRYIKIKNIKPFLNEANARLIIGITLTANGKFDDVGTGLKEGFSIDAYNIQDTEGEGLDIGAVEKIPETVDDKWGYLQSKSAGYSAKLKRPLLDYGVEGGFKFQS